MSSSVAAAKVGPRRRSVESFVTGNHVMNIGIVAPELHGHLNPMTTLGRELADRGHRVTFFGTPQAEGKVLGKGLGFHVIGAKEYETGEAQAAQVKLASLTGFSALKL